jgi:hypothetical protein
VQENTACLKNNGVQNRYGAEHQPKWVFGTVLEFKAGWVKYILGGFISAKVEK